MLFNQYFLSSIKLLQYFITLNLTITSTGIRCHGVYVKTIVTHILCRRTLFASDLNTSLGSGDRITL